jgi:hypothetical protein
MHEIGTWWFREEELALAALLSSLEVARGIASALLDHSSIQSVCFGHFSFFLEAGERARAGMKNTPAYTESSFLRNFPYPMDRELDCV